MVVELVVVLVVVEVEAEAEALVELPDDDQEEASVFCCFSASPLSR